MASRICVILLLFSIMLGCVYERQPMSVPTNGPSNVPMGKYKRMPADMPIVKHIVSPFQQYDDKNFDWSRIRRIVIMPVANQTMYPILNQEIQSNLATELQRAGYFEFVTAKIDDPAVRAQDVFTSGQFNEIEAVRVTREYQSDAILLVNITQYHPYRPPRLGLSMLLVYPAEGVTVASLSGLWDLREATTLQLAQAYLRQNQSWPRNLMSYDRIVQVPDVFQRFVCQQVAVNFHPPVPPPVVPAGLTQSTTTPGQETVPVETALPPGMEIPTLPPPAMAAPQP